MRIMKAYPYDVERLATYVQPFFVQPKLNGIRCRAEIRMDGVFLFTSKDKPILSVPHIKRELWELLGERNMFCVLDGELYVHGMSLQDNRRITAKTNGLNPDHMKMEFHVFDLIEENIMYLGRYIHLNHLWINYMQEAKQIKRVPTWVCTNEHQIERILCDVKAEGYEGVMVRNPDACYEHKVSTNMMKWKPKGVDSYEILECHEEIDIKYVPKGILGGFTCVNKEGETFKCPATGFTVKQRESMWKNKDELLGRYLTIKYPELTPRGVPFNPVAVEITGVSYE